MTLPTTNELRALWPFLSPRERAEVDRLLTTDPTPWRPLAGPQTSAYYSPADEVFYGGAAGGGKTDLLLGLAATAHQHSVIFRREYTQLKALIERSHDLFDGYGRFNANDNLWRFPDGRTLEFGAMQAEADKRNWQGRPHDFKGWDEVSNFLESQYVFVNGWTRTTTPGQRTRKVAAGNPPTDADGEWVIRRWGAWLDPQHPDPAQPGELRWYAMVDGQDTPRPDGQPFTHNGTTLIPQSRTFLPAGLADNPYLTHTGYEATLQALPEPLRSQLLFGNFQVGRGSDPYQVIPTAWVQAAQARWTPTPPDRPLSALGVDVARGGDDATVISPRYGTWFAPLLHYPGTDTPDGPTVAALVVQALPGTGRPMVNIDVIGVGSSVYDHLRGRCNAIPVNVAAASTATDRHSHTLGFVNLRAEAWWRLREALDPATGDTLALPPGARLRADLCAPRWTLRAGGIQLESKDEIRKRIGRSPDDGDAVVLAHLIASSTGVFL